MTITRNSFLSTLRAGAVQYFGQAYENIPMLKDQLCTVKKSEKAFEEFAIFSGLGLAQETAELGPVLFQDMQEGYIWRVNHKKFTTGYAVSQEAIDDDKVGLLMEVQSKEMAKTISYAQDQDAFNLINNGYTGSFTFGDGKTLFATDHPLTRGGTISNKLSVAADISEAALESMLIQLATWKSEAGLFVHVNPTRLVIHPAQQYDAMRILKSQKQSNTFDNNLNALNYSGALQQDPIISPFLTSTVGFTILTDASQGLTFMTRKDPDIKTDNAFGTEAILVKVSARWLATAIDSARSCIGTQGV